MRASRVLRATARTSAGSPVLAWGGTLPLSGGLPVHRNAGAREADLPGPERPEPYPSPTMSADTAGYSGTPLPRKLGVAAGARVAVLGAPADFADRLPDAVVRTRLAGSFEVIVLFARSRAQLDRRLAGGAGRARSGRRALARLAQAQLGRRDRSRRRARCERSVSRPASSTTRCARSTRPGRGCDSCAVARRADLLGGAQRVETPRHDLVEQRLEAGVAVQALLELRAPARRRLRDDLVAQVAPAARRERALRRRVMRDAPRAPRRAPRRPRRVIASVSSAGISGLPGGASASTPRTSRSAVCCERVVGLVDRRSRPGSPSRRPSAPAPSRPSRGRARARRCRRGRRRRSRPVRRRPSRGRSRRTRRRPSAGAPRAPRAASPPSAPRLAIERMKTPGSRKCSTRRIRSPSTAPPLNGEVGSTERTPTVAPAARLRAMSAPISVDFPAPGGPVTPTTLARPVLG